MPVDFRRILSGGLNIYGEIVPFFPAVDANKPCLSLRAQPLTFIYTQFRVRNIFFCNIHRAAADL